MIHARISERRAVPWWAAVGGPLVGVPLLIALLALVSPNEPASAPEPDAAAIEQVEVLTVGSDVDTFAHNEDQPYSS